MAELIINRDLVGQSVRNAARPEWGVGKVLRVQEERQPDGVAHRVSIQFATGHRTLLVPPAQLESPSPEPQRQAGWIDQLAGTTSDDRLRQLPKEALTVLGGPEEKLAALLPLFSFTNDPHGLVHWARRQTGVADPLSQWNRDELEHAFAGFCAERDAALRAAAAVIKDRRGPEQLKAVLAEVPEPLKPAVMQALRRPF